MAGIGLKPLPAQIGEATLYGGLISPLALDLLGIAILILLFHEAGNAVIGHLEYAVMLPDASKSDPEYVRQFNNVVNSHVLHTVSIIGGVALTTALALEFDTLMLDIVAVMLEEHKQGRAHVKGISEAVAEKNIKKAKQHLLGYRELLTEHIKKEDEILYPWMERSLTMTKVGELYAQFQQVDKKYGDSSTVRYKTKIPFRG